MRRDKNKTRLSVDSWGWLALFSSVFLLGCNTAPTKPTAAPEAVPHENDAGLNEALKAAPARQPLQSMESRMLERAESAFRAGRLLTPSHDNAYDRFQSVLLINPENGVARSGLQAILLAYAERVRNALKGGQPGTAGKLLRQAEIYYPANGLLLDLKKEIAKAREQEEKALLANAPENNARMDYPLPGGALSRKSPTINAYLARIAKRIQQSDESVMIYARSDSEGRWIYRQLKQAVPGYRVRGDIKIARSPKISILAPLQ